MEISNLDTAIRDSIEKINASSTQYPSYCGWMPTMLTRANEILQYVSENYPAFVQFVDYKTVQLPNGQIKRTIDFCIASPRTDDVLEVMHNQDQLEKFIYEFRDNLSEYYNCALVGELKRSVDVFTIREINIFFAMEIIMDREC